jgi:hypothetical protein
MQRSSACLALTGAALLLALGCTSAGTRSVQPGRLFTTELTAARISHGSEALPASATTFALDSVGAAIPPEMESLVASLLERRGWSLVAPGAEADLRVTVGDGSSTSREATYRGGGTVPLQSQLQRNVGVGSYGPGQPGQGDTLNRTLSHGSAGQLPVAGSTIYQHRLEVGLEAGGGAAWRGLAWDDGINQSYLASASRLAAALADRLPAPAKPSAERAAVDALGTDFLIFRSFAGPLRPAVLSVAPGSVVARAGWQPRDVLVSIGGADTADLTWNEVAAKLGQARSEAVRVELLRAGERYLTFLVPENPQRIH